MSTELQQSQLPELKEKLITYLPRSFEVMGCVFNIIRGKLQANIHVDEWPNFSAVVVQSLWPRVSEVADLVVFATSTEALISVLLEGDLITWGKRQVIISIDEKHMEYLMTTLKTKCPIKGTESWFTELDYCVSYYSKEIYGEVECPKGFFIDKLQPHHFDSVSHSWPYYKNMPHREAYIKYLIQHFESVGVFLKEDPDTPVSFTLQYPYGQVGFAYTVEEYRRKGLNTVALKEIVKRVLAAGFVNVSTERDEAAPPPKHELGFVKSCRTRYIHL